MSQVSVPLPASAAATAESAAARPAAEAAVARATRARRPGCERASHRIERMADVAHEVVRFEMAVRAGVPGRGHRVDAREGLGPPVGDAEHDRVRQDLLERARGAAAVPLEPIGLDARDELAEPDDLLVRLAPLARAA